MLKILVYVLLTILIAVTCTIAAMAAFEVCGPIPALLFLVVLVALAVMSRRMR